MFSFWLKLLQELYHDTLLIHASKTYTLYCIKNSFPSTTKEHNTTI
jgi:hypothetical protein